MMAGWLEPPMEVIPEEAEAEWLPPETSAIAAAAAAEAKRVSRRREIFTAEQVDTLVSTVPKDRVPAEWFIDNEIVDPKMATSYLTECLADPASARGSTYTYTYESHYDEPPLDDDDVRDIVAERTQTQKVTRVTKVTTTRSVRQIPMESPYDDIFFDSTGFPVPASSLVDTTPTDEIGIKLMASEMSTASIADDRHAPPPAPPLASRYANLPDVGVPDPPGTPEIVECEDAQVTLCWAPPTHGIVVGYQIEMRDYPDGDWERVHDHMLREPSCTITNLDTAGSVQFRVSAAGRAGFSSPSPSSAPVVLTSNAMPCGSTVLPLAPGRPVVVGVDGSRASVEWSAPPADAAAPPIVGYQLEYRVYGTNDWIVANDVLTTETRYHVDNLRPNGVYEFRVRARNAEGLGAASRCSGPAHIKPAVPLRSARSRPIPGGGLTATELRPPGQPQVLETDLNWVKLEWPGASDDEDVEYIVELREVGDPNWYQANQMPISTNSIHVEGLRPGSTYEFRVLSARDGLISLPSEVSDIVSLRPLWKASSQTRGIPSRPSAPEYLEVTGDRITLCWLPAKSTLPVLGYDVEFRDFAQDAGWYKVNDAPMSACKMTVGDLIIGHEYEFRVVALNSVGYSEPSTASAPVTIMPATNGDGKYVEAERFGAIRLLQEEMVRESPPLPDRDDSPPPIRRGQHMNGMQWRDPNLREVIDYLESPDKEKQRNASAYLQHLTYSDNSVKEETRELGGIPRLVNLLRSDEPATQRNAAACLKNLCFGKENDRNKIAILEADGVRMLSAVLTTCTASDERAKEATAALWNLSSADALKRPILDAATDPLVQIIATPSSSNSSQPNGHPSDPMKPYSSSLFKNGTGVLRNISAAEGITARQKLRKAPRLLEALIHFLGSAIQRNQVDSNTVENVACLLRNLSYRIQEVEDPNYDPAKAHEQQQNGGGSRRSKSAPSGSPKVKTKKNSKVGGKTVTEEEPRVTGPPVLWQPSTVRLYLKLLQESSNLVTLEACAGAVQNLAACQFAPSAQVRTAVRVEKGLPVLVELFRLKEDHVVCAVATALRNLAIDERNRDLIGKYALRDLLEKLPDPATRRAPNGPSDQTISAVLGILFEIVRSTASSTRDVHEAKGTERLRFLAKAYPAYSQRVCKYATQVLFMMWQHKELHDGFRRAGHKEADFYVGTNGKHTKNPGDSTTLSRPISSQGRERVRQANENAALTDTLRSSDYGTIGGGDTSQRATPSHRVHPPPHGLNGKHVNGAGNGPRYDEVPTEPLYASVRKGGVDDSWV